MFPHAALPKSSVLREIPSTKEKLCFCVVFRQQSSTRDIHEVMQYSAEASGTLGYGSYRSYGALHVQRDHWILVLQSVVLYQLQATGKNI